MIIHNATRDLHDAIVKCEVHNDVGKSEETETLDITCKYTGVRYQRGTLYLVKKLFNTLITPSVLVIGNGINSHNTL